MHTRSFSKGPVSRVRGLCYKHVADSRIDYAHFDGSPCLVVTIPMLVTRESWVSGRESKGVTLRLARG